MIFSATAKKNRVCITTSINYSLWLMLAVFFVTASLPQPLRGAENVSLFSRLDFAPALLEMISIELKQKTGRQFSLIVRPVESANASAAGELNDYLLVEDGIARSSLPPEIESTGISIKLIWAMAVRNEVSHLFTKKIITLQDFGTILNELKKRFPDRFPWFEGLLSRNSARNFCLLLGEKKRHKYSRNLIMQPFWKQLHAAAILSRAIETEVLNPLSVEADLSLAMEVFEAGDAMFVSHWVPESVFSGSPEVWPGHKSGFLIPFPCLDGLARLPVLSLRLWKTSRASTVNNLNMNTVSDASLSSMIRLNYASETVWLEKNFAQFYDSLIVGDL
ncbi:MAG: hypothetical protein PHD82_05395 [Candidatus Riflebacteria bacterium]|jgi:hypothetical protein|nr:hypothetical protein [Candidatus Riflebacteria bacterium]